VNYFVLIYKSKSPREKEEIVKSQIVDWTNLIFKPHDKGGRRDFFDRPTAMFNRVEMHVTTLNEGLNSHLPHKHIAEEMEIKPSLLKRAIKMAQKRDFDRVRDDLDIIESILNSTDNLRSEEE
jgi:hypothetical protein